MTRISLFGTLILVSISHMASATESAPLLPGASFRAMTIPAPVVDTPLVDTIESDSSSILGDTIQFDFSHGFSSKHRRKHVFSIPELSDARQIPYIEPFSFVDFNRVTGFFFGVGTPSQVDIGRHQELGAEGSVGYGFASGRWEYRLGGEFRLPLADVKKILEDTNFKKHIYSPPTIAIGAGIHNLTSTDDSWRTGRLENALDAFFAREDFRDYYKLAGWNGYLAFRPEYHTEFRAEWRSDHYESLSQNVFYGRFGGNKVLPPNPATAVGTMNSLVLEAQHEHAHTRDLFTTNIFGDSIELEQLTGCSALAQMELGHMPGSAFGFNRFLIDAREFLPILAGLNFDARFRFESTTGDMVSQKLEYLGGPSSLPALYNKSIGGNRMLLLNTEIRINLEALSSFFHSADINLIVFNDFGKMGIAGTNESIAQGWQINGINSFIYNYGVGLGWTNGIQVGAEWRSDIKADARIIFRLQRAF